ncbi:MAG TPA: PASTA domain-containing protein [Pyrinomonadaceae bacterium]
MSVVSKGLSAVGKLVFVGVLLGVFFVSMAAVVYMSLHGEEVTVPNITGKDFVDSEKELAALGLRIRKRADRESVEKMNTVIEQLPKAGETVKSGQWISVVVSKAGLTPDEAPPPSLKQDIEEDDSKKIEEMITDKPKRSRASSNTNANSDTDKKTADTTRDTIANTSTSAANDSKSDTTDATKKDSGTDSKKDDAKNEKQDGPKPQATPIQGRPSSAKPPANQRP